MSAFEVGMLVLDTFMWVLDKKTGMYLREANILSTELYYIFSPLPCMGLAKVKDKVVILLDVEKILSRQEMYLLKS